MKQRHNHRPPPDVVDVVAAVTVASPEGTELSARLRVESSDPLRPFQAAMPAGMDVKVVVPKFCE